MIKGESEGVETGSVDMTANGVYCGLQMGWVYERVEESDVSCPSGIGLVIWRTERVELRLDGWWRQHHQRCRERI